MPGAEAALATRAQLDEMLKIAAEEGKAVD